MSIHNLLWYTAENTAKEIYGNDNKEITGRFGTTQNHSSLLLIQFLSRDTNKVGTPPVSSERG